LGQVPRREASEGWDLMTTEEPPNRGDVPRIAAGFTTRSHVFQVLVLGSWVSRTGRKKIGHMETANPNKIDLVFIKELLKASKVVPVIDRTNLATDAGSPGILMREECMELAARE